MLIPALGVLLAAALAAAAAMTPGTAGAADHSAFGSVATVLPAAEGEDTADRPDGAPAPDPTPFSEVSSIAVGPVPLSEAAGVSGGPGALPDAGGAGPRFLWLPVLGAGGVLAGAAFLVLARRLYRALQPPVKALD